MNFKYQKLMKTKFYFLLVSFFISNYLFAQEVQFNPSTNTFFLSKIPNVSGDNNVATPAYWGVCFWEFGDGNYKTIVRSAKDKKDRIQVRHQYKTKGNYKVKITLTPLYTSVQRPRTFSKSFQISKTGNNTSQYLPTNSQIAIANNSSGEAVPGHQIRTVVNYKLPPSIDFKEGYIAFFYNKTQETGNNIVLEFLSDSIAHYPSNNIILLNTSQSSIEAVKKNVEYQLGAYRRYQFFKVKRINAGAEQRLFFNLQSTKRLSSFSNKETPISIEAVWIPIDKNKGSKAYSTHYTFKVLPYHDPNRIKVKPNVAYFKKQKTTEFTYSIDFQNDAKAPVPNLEIVIPIDKSLNLSSINNVQSSAYRGLQSLSKCPQGTEIGKTKCWTMDNSRHPDSVYFKLHNIDLLGPDSDVITMFNRRYTKGNIKFNIQSSNVRSRKTKTKAAITFEGLLEAEKTRNTSIKWREAGIFLKIGANFNNDFGIYNTVEENIFDRYNLGITYLNTPVGTGFIRGFAFNYSTFNMERTFDSPITNNPSFQNGAMYSQTENIEADFAELQAIFGYQVLGSLRFFVKTGPSIPFRGDAFVESEVVNFTIDETPLITDAGRGWLLL